MKISRAFVACLLVLALVFAAWVYGEVSDRRAKSPKSRAANYAEYRRNLRPPERARSFQKDGAEYYATIGRTRESPLALPSGAPVYIFDRSGHLVDFTFDSGKDPDFSSRWQETSQRQLTVAELDAILLPRVPATP